MVATLVSSEEDVKLLRKILVYFSTSTVSQVHSLYEAHEHIQASNLKETFYGARV